MTIYEIKQKTEQTSPFYFSPKTLKSFGQTMKSFKVYKQDDGRFKICAPMRERDTKKYMGESVRYFNPENNKLERN